MRVNWGFSTIHLPKSRLSRDMVKNGHKSKDLWILITFKEIEKIMGLTGSRAAVLSNRIDFKIKNQKQWRISDELKELVKKYYWVNGFAPTAKLKK